MFSLLAEVRGLSDGKSVGKAHSWDKYQLAPSCFLDFFKLLDRKINSSIPESIASRVGMTTHSSAR